MAPDGSPALDPGKASTEGGDNVPPDTLACWEDKLAALDLSGEAGPVLRHGEWKQVKKGEDLMLVKEDFKLGGRDVSCFCVSGHRQTNLQCDFEVKEVYSSGQSIMVIGRRVVPNLLVNACPGG